MKYKKGIYDWVPWSSVGVTGEFLSSQEIKNKNKAPLRWGRHNEPTPCAMRRRFITGLPRLRLAMTKIIR